MNVNDYQVGGDHYRVNGVEYQHWDLAADLGFDYFQGVITKYLDRWKFKNGAEDLKKAQHYLAKYLTLPERHLKAWSPEPGILVDRFINGRGYDETQSTIFRAIAMSHYYTDPELLVKAASALGNYIAYIKNDGSEADRRYTNQG